MKTRPLMLICCTLILHGCITIHSYVDPQYHHASFGDLTRVEPPYALSIKVQYQVNGVDRPKADRSLLDHVERSLRASGVAVPYEGKGDADGEMSVIVNDVGDIKAAAAKGFGTGLTFGLIGSHVSDNYEVTVRLTQVGGVTEQKYQHAILSTVGNASGPPGLTAVPLAMAVNQVADDIVLNFLKDMQASGNLTPRIRGAL
jgi:hypothetical protein